MWFTSDRPEHPRRRPSHPTVIAYLALLVAVLGIPATAVAAGALIHTRNIANRAVTTPKLARHAVGPFRIMNGAVVNRTIRNHAVGRVKLRNDAVNTRVLANGAVTRPKIRDHAITGAKVATGTITAGNINVATLPAASLTGPISTTDGAVTYTQPAHTRDVIYGRWAVTFPPSNCTSAEATFHLELLPHHFLVATSQTVSHFNNGQLFVHGEAAIQSTGAPSFLSTKGLPEHRELEGRVISDCLTSNHGPHAVLAGFHVFVLHIPAQR